MHYCKNSYIWALEDWPLWRYDLIKLISPMCRVSHQLGVLEGRLQNVSREQRDAMNLVALTNDVVNTSKIEGIHFNTASVKSSLAWRLGIDIGALAPVDRHVEGVVEMVLDATGRCDQPLSKERLFGWHAALFPTGYSGLYPVQVGKLRDDAHGPMQVVSGPIGRERVHFEGPPASRLEAEVSRFLDWLNTTSQEHPLIKAGIGHLWFVTLHPFDDGNGRIARAIGDLLLARADGCPQRYYSLSAQIQHERNAYYDILERTQKGSLDITDWLLWFFNALSQSAISVHKVLDDLLVSHSSEEGD